MSCHNPLYCCSCSCCYSWYSSWCWIVDIVVGPRNLTLKSVKIRSVVAEIFLLLFFVIDVVVVDPRNLKLYILVKMGSVIDEILLLFLLLLFLLLLLIPESYLWTLVQIGSVTAYILLTLSLLWVVCKVKSNLVYVRLIWFVVVVELGLLQLMT